MNLPFASRALWPYALLRIVFAVLAMFSAAALYIGIPYLAQFPILFAIAVTVMFVVEACLFELCIRLLEGSVPRWLASGSKQAVWLFMNFVMTDPSYTKEEAGTPRGLLKFFNAAGTRVLETSFFATAAWSIWHRYSCADKAPFKAWLACARPAVLPCTLAVMIGVVYYLSRRSVDVELSLVEKLFPQNRIPEEWTGPKDPLAITISVIAFFALYVVLAWVSDYIKVVSLLMLVIACIDFNTRRLINVRIEAYFTDSKYAPHPDDEDCNRISERRIVIRKYLHKPHLRKEAARAAGFAAAFVIAMSGMRSVSYLVLIATIIINEVVTTKWRAERRRALSPFEVKA